MAEGDRVAGTGQEILRDPEKEKKDNKEAAFGKKMRSEGCFFYYVISSACAAGRGNLDSTAGQSHRLKRWVAILK